MHPGRLRISLVVISLALVPLACGEDDEAPQGSARTETSASAAAEALENTSLKPEIPKPAGSPPRNLEIEDIVRGKGPPAKPGDNVVVQYVGVNFSTGEEFDASWTTGQPYRFPLGGGQVIEGWDKGIVGMRKGGRRKLTIPPRMGYGAEGSPPAIGPNETLVFVVDLLAIR
jgi:peptidylprolyl isomerase